MSIIGPPRKKYHPSVSDSKPLLQYSFSVLYNVYIILLLRLNNSGTGLAMNYKNNLENSNNI